MHREKKSNQRQKLIMVWSRMKQNQILVHINVVRALESRLARLEKRYQAPEKKSCSETIGTRNFEQ